MTALVRSLGPVRSRALLSILMVLGAIGAVPLTTWRESSAATLRTVVEPASRAPGAEASALNTAPTVSISPSPGQFSPGQQVLVTITYCDSQSLDTATAIRRFNNVNMSWPITYTIGNPGSCLARAVTSGTVTLQPGANTVLASIEDADPVPLWSRWATATYSTAVHWTGATVTPYDQFVEATVGSAAEHKFLVQNLGDNTTTFALSATGVGLYVKPLTGKAATANIAAGATVVVSVSDSAPTTTYASGRVILSATAGGNSASAFTEVAAVPSPTYSAGVALVNPSGITDRSLCVAISTGPGAAMECGDLRLAYGIPGLVTRGKARTPTLVYSSASAHPTIALPADLTLVNPGGLGTTFTASVEFLAGSHSGNNYSAGSWLTADFAGVSGKRRILATFDGANLATGRHVIRLKVQMSGGTLYQTTGELLVVNRLASPFNAGWWLGGLEQLVPYTTSGSAADTVLWVGGDGSARVYKETGNNTCIFTHEALDVPEKLLGTPSGGACVNMMHLYGDSLRVLFDAAGNHIETRNRIGESTVFAWNAGKLTSITVPSGTVSRQYSFVYTGGVLDSVIAPGTPSENRAVKLTTVTGSVVGGAGRVRTTGYRGPDLTSVSFGYQGGSGPNQGDYRIVSRSDRMGIVTTFAFDSAYKLASASTPASPSQTVTLSLRAAEGQGKGTGAAGQALHLDSVHTRLDGPRTDVADVSRWWINRYGAPVRSRNPVGMESKITYHAGFPALPEKVIDAAGMTTVAVYNARGLVDRVIARSPYGAADSAMTTVVWDPVWNKPLSVTDPNGLATVATYDPTTGNTLTSRVGTNSARTVQFSYDATTKLLRRVTPPLGGSDSVYYDAELGNVMRTKSPGGSVAWSYRDRLGRDTLIVTSVDTILGTTSKQMMQRFVYDSAGRVKETRASAPTMAYTLMNPADDTLDAPVAEEVTTRNTYDAEGRVRTVHTFSTPNPLVVADSFAPVYVESECELHCAGVPSGTVGSFDIRTYDWIGRPLTQRLGSGPASVVYDPAGNVVSQTSRLNHTITSSYDAAGRLIRQAIPSVTNTWEGCDNFEYGMLNGMPPMGQCMMQFPYYPSSGSSLVIPADTVRFVFNSAGRMVRADNRDALVTRSYYTNGALASETQAIRSYATASFTTNVYAQSYKYDLGGRRIKHGLPIGTDSVTYAYSTETGAMSEIRRGSHSARFYLDLNGRQDSVEVLQSSTIGVIEKRRYDMDGQLTQLLRRRLDGGSYVNLLDDSLTYDARGKMRRVRITSASIDVNQQIAETYYSGLGAVVASGKRVPGNYSWETEEFRTSAVGTSYWSRTAKGSAADRHAQLATFEPDGGVKDRFPAIPPTDSFYTDHVKNKYDNAGNTTHSTAQFSRQLAGVSDPDRFYSATRTYYSAANRLVVVQRYFATEGGRSGAWEEFRYDALGRRVLSRTRRPSGPDGWIALCSTGSCHEWIERTIWDGNNALYEGRVNVTDSSTSSAMDMLYSTGLQWGLVGYVHAGGYDRPIFTMDGRVPSYNWRGLPESSVWTNGAKADCSLGGPTCTMVAWPSANTIYLKPSPWGGWQPPPAQWVGTLLADGAGSTGMLYRRNRYYDPTSGQFTQQDPIGIAGGANVYGFVGGDPVNYSDPFGLCPVCPVLYVASAGGVVLSAEGAVATVTAGMAALATAAEQGVRAAMVLREFTGQVLDWVDDGLHGNSRDSTRPTVGYTLRDIDTGEIRKIGQTSRPTSRYSKRWLADRNLEMVPEAVGSKSEMLAWEAAQIAIWKAKNEGRRPPENKVDRE